LYELPVEDVTTLPKGPLRTYLALRKKGELSADPEQEKSIHRLQMLHDELLHYPQSVPQGERRKRSVLGRLMKRRTAIAPRGVYIHGDVGRGKSMVMDLFFDKAPLQAKRRVHFHAFMLEVHDMIAKWRQMDKAARKAFSGGMAGDDPLPPLALKVSRETTLLCFDEFQVSDVADAMILGRLFTELFAQGVVVVITSNRTPNSLYEGGLNRQLFIPFIELIEQKLDVVTLDGPTDYRLERLKGMPVYHWPLGDVATQRLSDAFWRLTDHEYNDMSEVGPEEFEVKGRVLHVPVASRGVAVFSFKRLCANALGAADYLAIAWRYHTVIVTGIPKMGPDKRNEAKRFVTLIDVLYENNVKFLCCAEVPPEELYAQGDGRFEFSRTVSRLMEMQSEEYLARGHAV